MKTENETSIDNFNTTLQKTDISNSALRVLNYVKKHKCQIRMRWYCGIRVYKVWKNDKELSYPHLNEEIWSEISKYFKRYGHYQLTHFYYLH